MKRGIPRPGGIPRPQQVGTRLPQLRPPAVVVKTPVVQVAPRRVLVAPKTAPKVRSAPVITAVPKSASRVIARGPPPQIIPKVTPVRVLQTPRQTVLPTRISRISTGIARRVPRPVPAVVPVAAPVVTVPASPVVVRTPSPVIAPVPIPASPVRVGNSIVMVPDEVVQVTPPRSVAAEFAYSPVSPLECTMPPEEFSCLSPTSPVGMLDFSFSPDLANEMTTSFAAVPAFSPVRSPSKYGYVDVSPITGEIMPSEFSMFSPEPIYNESVLLQSPSTGQPMVLDVAVNPQPVVTTTSGDHIVCDISMNVRDPMLSPLGASRGFRRGRARELLASRSQPDYLNTTIEWDNPEDLVNEYMPVGLAPPYEENDLMCFSPGNLIDFSPQSAVADLIQFW